MAILFQYRYIYGMKRRLATLALALCGLPSARAETLSLTCTGGNQPAHFRIGSGGEVEMNGKPYRPDSFTWHADVISFRIPIEERRFAARWTFHQEWVIDRGSGEAKYAFLGRVKAIATYRCRDPLTGKRSF